MCELALKSRLDPDDKTDMPSALTEHNDATESDRTSTGFDIWYQPIVTASDGAIAAVEALVRVGEGEGADEDLLESRDLLARVVERVRTHVDVLAGTSVSLNLSEQDLESRYTGALVASLVDALGPGSIDLEVSELFAPFSPQASRQLDTLTGLGVELVIDHFGAGMTPTAVRSHSFAGVKLDRALLADRRPNAIGVAEALATFAANLSLEVTAVGVEDPAVVATLSDAGVKRFQGYMFEAAMPVDELATKLR